jgi:integrase
LFISTAGTRLIYCNVRWTFHRLVQQAGLVTRSAWCRPGGGGMREVSDRLGNSSIVITADTYAHIAPELAARVS